MKIIPRNVRAMGRIASLATFVAVAGPAPAQTGGGYDLSWWSIESGGGISEGGGYKLAGAVGQPEATGTVLTGGLFTLTPGFLQDSAYFPVPVSISGFYLE